MQHTTYSGPMTEDERATLFHKKTTGKGGTQSLFWRLQNQSHKLMWYANEDQMRRVGDLMQRGVKHGNGGWQRGVPVTMAKKAADLGYWTPPGPDPQMDLF